MDEGLPVRITRGLAKPRRGARNDGRRDRLRCRPSVNTRNNSSGDAVGGPEVNDSLVFWETDGNGAWGAYLPDIDGVGALGETR